MNRMKMNRNAIFTWIFFILIVASFLTPNIIVLAVRTRGENPNLSDLLFSFIPVSFAFVGALILSHQPGNRIGLLMMLPGVSLSTLVDAYLKPFINGGSPLPQIPSVAFLFILWFSNWNWVLLVFPLMFIMLLFPTGRPLSPRWGRLIYVGLGLASSVVFLATFNHTLAPGQGRASWSYPNPIGFLTAKWNNVLLTPLLIVFLVWIILCAFSLFIRFRGARGIERQQIKWLFFGGAVFAVCYFPAFLGNTFGYAQNILNLLFGIGLLAFPAAIAMAIFRYRLYDIEIIIRRTLSYAILTVLLGLGYFGIVTVLQALISAIGGQKSAAITVVSTLAIAALFHPLRRLVQEFIDRRFYRKKYDAQVVLQHFGQIVSSETDLDQISAQVIHVTESTLQPGATQLWLKK